MTTSKDRAALLKVPVSLLATVWAAFLLDWILPVDLFRALGIVPRTAAGAWGILVAPFLHLDFAHLAANSVPLLVLTALLAAIGKGWGTIAALGVASGGLLWAFGRGGTVHGGASGLIYALAVFLVIRGVVEKRGVPLVVSGIVAFAYGGALLSGVLPTQTGVSWDGHLLGGVAGFLAATGKVKPKGEAPSPPARGSVE